MKNQHTGSHSVFGYPGNKASASDWIIRNLPQHRVYVEVFGGAAGVLANKPESHIEVYNDIDGDLVNFFDVLRERGDELVEWLRNLPYARKKYEEWATRWHNEGWRPDDPVRRAGVLFFLQASSHVSKYRYKGGFAISKIRNQPQTYQNQVARLETFDERFRGQVLVENQDWRDCLEKWDDTEEDVLFFLDPPTTTPAVATSMGWISTTRRSGTLSAPSMPNGLSPTTRFPKPSRNTLRTS